MAYGNRIEDGTASSATVTLLNTILANSIVGTNDLVNNKVDGNQANTATVNFSGCNLVKNRINLSGATSTGAPTVTADPLLGPLTNNGGLTPTMALLPGSPAIDQGISAGTLTDQRGVRRPFDVPGVPNAADGSDIGAYEFNSLPATPGTVSAWGDSTFGQTDIAPGLVSVVAIAAGVYHSLALKADGTVIGWGQNDFGQTNPPLGLSNVTAIAAGWGTSLALRGDGRWRNGGGMAAMG